MSTLVITIPGPPQPQQRSRAVLRGGRAGVYEPKESRSWKGTAQVWMQKEMRKRKPWEAGVALSVDIEAVFPCPASAHKKIPVGFRWHTKAQGDCDNIAKAVLDAGNGVLWDDDRQVAMLTVRKFVAAQGQLAHVRVRVEEL